MPPKRLAWKKHTEVCPYDGYSTARWRQVRIEFKPLVDFAGTASTPADKVHVRLTIASAVALPLTLKMAQLARTAVQATGSDDREAKFADTSDAHLPVLSSVGCPELGAPVVLALYSE